MKELIRHPKWALEFLAFLAISHQLSTPLAAATITVSNTNDVGSGSLRQAIQDAAAGDTINFSVTGSITLTTGELLVTYDLVIVGPGAAGLAISGNTNSRVFEIGSNATVTISNLIIRDGHAPDGMTAGGDGESGGGIYNSGTLTLARCSVSGNTGGNGYSYPFPGGGKGGVGGAGGGIYNAGTLALFGCSTGTLRLINCTLSGNGAGDGGIGRLLQGVNGGAGGDGGAIFTTGSMSLVACTLSDNRAGRGGNATQCGYPGDGGNGGGIFNAGGTAAAKLHNTLVALNYVGTGGVGGGPCFHGGHAGIGPDLYGTFTTQGHNLVGVPVYWAGLTNGVNNDLVGPLDPMLGPLQVNGGNTLTMALLPGSLALDAGDDALLGTPLNLTTDQRGLARKSGAHVDIGAFELQIAGAPPHLANPTLLGNGAFGFVFTNTPGASFTVLATTNLSLPWSEWPVLGGAIEFSPSQFQFNDTQATNHSQRFYRVRSP